jgi:tetratricopeptide (TPR) repeat protein
MQGNVSEGRRNLLHAVERFDIPQTTAGVKALELAAYFAYVEHDEADARKWADRLMKVAKALGNDLWLAHAWQTRGLLEPDHAQRVRLAKRVIELAGDDPFARHAIEALGLLALEHGDAKRAYSHFQRACEIGDKIGDRNMVIGALILLAIAAEERGDYDDAILRLRAGVEEARRIGDKTSFIWERAWTVGALLLTARGATADALRLLAAAARLREEERTHLGGFTEAFNRRAVAKVRATLSEEEADREWREGRRHASREYLSELLSRLD